jgi:hypothetical protein
MKRDYTIYFDTKFYVQLCGADEAEADQIIRTLNALNVRHVVSNVLLRELLTSKDRNERDEILVKRVRQFTVAPYRTAGDLDWEVLLLAGQDRINMAELLRTLHDAMTVATSNSIMARRGMNPEHEAELLNANRPVLEEWGFPEDFNQENLAQVMSAAKGIFDLASGVLDGLGRSHDVEWPEDPTPADLSELSERIKGVLDPSDVAYVEEQNRIQDSSTRSEDRPYQVAIGAASLKSAKALSNTLRDTEHIMLFVQHQDEIDLLQVDKPHQAIINRAKPKHRIAELGLAHRCFSADSLLDTVAKVRQLMPLRSQ